MKVIYFIAAVRCLMAGRLEHAHSLNLGYSRVSLDLESFLVPYEQDVLRTRGYRGFDISQAGRRNEVGSACCDRGRINGNGVFTEAYPISGIYAGGAADTAE